MNFHDKAVLVTGGSRGIGRAARGAQPARTATCTMTSSLQPTLSKMVRQTRIEPTFNARPMPYLSDGPLDGTSVCHGSD